MKPVTYTCVHDEYADVFGNDVIVTVTYEVDPGEPQTEDCPGADATVSITAVAIGDRSFDLANLSAAEAGLIEELEARYLDLINQGDDEW